jgi:hypothetical protein
MPVVRLRIERPKEITPDTEQKNRVLSEITLEVLTNPSGYVIHSLREEEWLVDLS